MQCTLELQGTNALLILHITEIRETNITSKYRVAVIVF